MMGNDGNDGNDGKLWEMMGFEHKLILCCNICISIRFRWHNIYIPFLLIVRKSCQACIVIQPIETHQPCVKMMENDGKWWNPICKMMENDGNTHVLKT